MDWMKQGLVWTANAVCTECGQEFSVERKRPTGTPPARCKPCFRKFSRERQYSWREANPERWKQALDRHNAKRLADPEHLRRKREREAQRLYGISADEMQILVDAQGGRCAICGGEGTASPVGKGKDPSRLRTPLHVDHCHTTGRIRGLLCSHCNTMIGLAREDPAILLAAIEYLRRE